MMEKFILTYILIAMQNMISGRAKTQTRDSMQINNISFTRTLKALDERCWKLTTVQCFSFNSSLSLASVLGLNAMYLIIELDPGLLKMIYFLIG